MISIGKLSKQTGVKIPTIRYYEQIGLIDPPIRSEGNQRRYRESDQQRLGFIKHARELGFSIEAIAMLIELKHHPDKPCAEADAIAREQLKDVREKIAQLKKLETELERISAGCDYDNGVVSGCYALSALSDHGQCSAEHH